MLGLQTVEKPLFFSSSALTWKKKNPMSQRGNAENGSLRRFTLLIQTNFKQTLLEFGPFEIMLIHPCQSNRKLFLWRPGLPQNGRC